MKEAEAGARAAAAAAASERDRVHEATRAAYEAELHKIGEVRKGARQVSHMCGTYLWGENEKDVTCSYSHLLFTPPVRQAFRLAQSDRDQAVQQLMAVRQEALVLEQRVLDVQDDKTEAERRVSQSEALAAELEARLAEVAAAHGRELLAAQAETEAVRAELQASRKEAQDVLSCLERSELGSEEAIRQQEAMNAVREAEAMMAVQKERFDEALRKSEEARTAVAAEHEEALRAMQEELLEAREETEAVRFEMEDALRSSQEVCVGPRSSLLLETLKGVGSPLGLDDVLCHT